MSASATPPSDLGPLRSQDTLEPLTLEGDHLSTASGERRYPVAEGLVFMGYPERDAAQLAELMAEERDWQADPSSVAADEDFLRKSAPRAVELVNLVRRLTDHRDGLRSLELGAGSGWVTWLMARAGFDPWLCDFEVNSLYSGWIYEHPRLGPGRRVVADARYAPFADGFFDVVLLKEFAHHIADTRSLFAEANRLLRPGGLLVLMEPTRSVNKALRELRHPDPHQGHEITWPDRYLWQLRRSGFRPRWTSISYWGQPRHRAARAVHRRAEQAVAGLQRNRSPLAALHLRLLGGASFVYAGRKVRTVAGPPRPPMRVIEPSALRLSAGDRAAWEGCRALVEAAAAQLR